LIIGQDKAVEQFAAAWASRKLHHAWLLAGPKGVGKATFAHSAARRVLADAAGPVSNLPALQSDEEHRIGKLVDAHSHYDFRWLERLINEKTDKVARNISVDQVRELGEFLGLTPALSPWRVIVIDSIDDLEKSAANALLKMLEEPPPNTLFFLVSHAPGRLLPTIRSRCRRLNFDALGDDAMTSTLEEQSPGLSAAERNRIVDMSFGSAGRALAFAELGLAKLEEAALAILRQGDPTNGRRAELATELGKKASAERYAAFLELAPSLIAREARGLRGSSLRRALDAYANTRELAALAPRLSLDPAATVFQIGGFLADVAGPVTTPGRP
jgi:DNA polymerase III subunit delta'